jgi:DNA polymerase-3 subunit alpha
VAANHGIDSKGNGRGFFTLQDYSSSIDVSLWRDDYQKFKHLFEVGQCLYIRGVYEPRWRGAEQFAFNIKDAKQLAEMEDTIVDSVTIKVLLEKVTPPFVDEFKKMVDKYKGKNKLKLELVDVEERLILPMYSRTFKVKVNNEFIEQLEEMNLQYSLE